MKVDLRVLKAGLIANEGNKGLSPEAKAIYKVAFSDPEGKESGQHLVEKIEEIEALRYQILNLIQNGGNEKEIEKLNKELAEKQRYLDTLKKERDEKMYEGLSRPNCVA